ncbi:MAG: hypothetical protein HY033_11815 [Ignavibacteriae bacterium]|nr:hypothetical protein [Ignavibacteria bacterium]MBI3365580.1 hypothetical protein [Ignavibacteriota bacterium]
MKRFCIFSVLVLIGTHGFAQMKQRAANERTRVDLTIYNQNLSLIREERTLNISSGLSHVVIPDIPATIDGTSLHFSSLTDPLSVRVLEQNYQYDLVSQSKLLEKYIGKDVQFVRLNEETKKEYIVTGKLLTAGFGAQPMPRSNYTFVDGMVAEINGKIEINPAGRLILPDLPEGLILKPQLEWLVENTRPGEHKTEISYLAGQLSWNANYVALLDKSDTKLDMTGWVTLTNNSGTTFKDAGLKLVAGDVNMVREEFDRVRPMMDGLAAAKTMEPQFKQTDLFEFKLYTLQRRTDLNNNETKQIELVTGTDVPSKKSFIYDGLADQWRYWFQNVSYRNQESFGQQSNTKVGVYVTFKNDQKSGLGIPLPKGKVRVYKRDDDGREQFIGEDEIDHTPKDEELRLYLGNAFDIVGERAQVDFKAFPSGRSVEETIHIKVRNHKTEPVEVQVYEHPWRWSEWQITKSSTDYEKVDQSMIKFPVKIGKDEEKVVTYTIRYSW